MYGYDELNKQLATTAFSSQELDNMRAMLDNPDVSAANKQNFLYVLSNAGRISDAEISRYANQVDADAEDIQEGGEDINANLKNARNSLAGAEEDKWKAGAERTASRTDQAQRALNQGGFSTSDEIIDEAEIALKLFEDFHPRYEEAVGLVGGVANGPDEPRQYEPVSVDPGSSNGEGNPGSSSATYSHSGLDPLSIRQGMDEFRGVEFSAFHADAEMLSTAHEKVSAATDALDSAWSSNTGDWTGNAKAAAAQVNNGLVDGAGDLSQALRTAPESITHSIDEGVQGNVIGYAQNLLQTYGDGSIAQLSPQQVDAFIDAKRELPGLIEKLESSVKDLEDQGFLSGLMGVLKFVSPISHLVGYNFAAEITKENINSELEKCKGALREAETKLREFCGIYKKKAGEVHGHGRAFVNAIDESYSKLIKFLGQQLDPDPFAVQDKGKPGGENSSGTGGTGSGGGGGSGSIPSGGGGGSIPGAGSGGGGGGGIPSAEDMKPDMGKQTNPVTGEPMEINPKTGEPYPIDPETGEAVKDGAEPETLTVEQGEQKFEITEPGDDGKMGISVENGSGELKDYKLDFGTGDGGPGGEPGEAGKAETFGPEGTGDAGSPSEGGEKVYRPGPDGKIHVEDGDLTLTAEQPEGPDGPTVVTVDDGTGEPTTYTLGSDDTGEAAAGSDSVAGTTSAGTAAPGVDTGSTGGGSPDASAAADRSPGSGPAAEGAEGGSGGGPTGPDVASSETMSADAGTPDASSGPVAPEASTPDATAADSGASDSASTEGAGSDTSAESESQTTTPQAVDGGGGGSAAGGGGGGGDLSAGSQSGTDSPSTPSGAGLGTAPGGLGGEAAAASQGSSGGASGAGMMGGMGAGGGGGQGGDEERSSSYRVDGDIFESLNTGVRITGTIGDTAEASVRFTR